MESILPLPVLAGLLLVPAAAAQVHQPFVAVAAKTFPAVVTVRSFVRAEAAPPTTGDAPAAPTSGWVVSSDGERDYEGFVPHASASGFFVGTDGDVLTTLLPLRRGERLVDLVEIETTTGQRAIAEVVGIEPTLQLAVLRGAVFASWEKPEFPGLAFGDSDALPLGTLLCAVGDPVGPERFLGIGPLVAKPSRDCYQELLSATYLQATMAVPDEAIGGPLVDLDGNVVGLLSRLDPTIAGSGAARHSAWALPSKILQGLYESIREAGTTQSPWLGFSVTSRAEVAAARGFAHFQALPKPRHGILLENVFTPSPAAAAGLRPGDWLTHFGGVEIHAPVGFQKQLYLTGVGRSAKLTIWRDGTTHEHELRIEVRPAAATPR
jgi:serine protease Do